MVDITIIVNKPISNSTQVNFLWLSLHQTKLPRGPYPSLNDTNIFNFSGIFFDTCNTFRKHLQKAVSKIIQFPRSSRGCIVNSSPKSSKFFTFHQELHGPCFHKSLSLQSPDIKHLANIITAARNYLVLNTCQTLFKAHD